MPVPISASQGHDPLYFSRAGFQSCQRQVEYSGGSASLVQ
jgi:hypothetical protein